MTRQIKIQNFIEQQAELYPYKNAIIAPNGYLTYEALNQKSNQFARYLQTEGVKPGNIIPIVADKSLNALVAILGILKTGAAYSPLNLESPSNHIEAILKELNPNLFCLETTSSHRFNIDGIKIINIDHIESLFEEYSNENFNSEVESDLAYVIYTSGTTGTPKGGMITHANLIPTFYSWNEAYNLNDSDIHLQMANFSFDVFVGDWIRALCSGGTLVLCPKNILLNPQSLYEFIRSNKVNCGEFVPAILRQLINYVEKNNLDLKQFRLLICGSDQWTMNEYRLVKRFCGDKTRVISSYGLTETTIDSSFFEEETTKEILSNQSLVPIGKPFKHVKLYLLNENNKIISPGEIGEICIGGLGVGLGYFNRPELTEKRFIKLTLDENEVYIYKTGDQGRLLPEGNLEFLGRNQEHVKINGARVDIPSLESFINLHPKIKYAVVVPVQKTNADNFVLSCFITFKDASVSRDELVKYIQQSLPCYYTPQKFYQIDAIPLSLNGKVDRKQLTSLQAIELKTTIVKPKNNIQQKLLNIWKEVLDINDISINNAFHELGGSSLAYVLMIEKVNKAFGIKLSHTQHFDSINELAPIVEQTIKLKMFTFNDKNSLLFKTKKSYADYISPSLFFKRYKNLCYKPKIIQHTYFSNNHKHPHATIFRSPPCNLSTSAFRLNMSQAIPLKINAGSETKSFISRCLRLIK